MRNKKVWVWTFLAVPSIFFFLVLGVLGIFVGVADKNIRLLGLSCGTCCLVSAFWIFFSFINFVENKLKQETSKSIVRVWTHNGVIRVVPELDWRLCREMYERNVLIGLANECSRLDPSVVILFSSQATDYKTGEINECQELLKGCSVERVEMFVPAYDKYSVNLQTAWKLIHGPDAQPPTTS